MKSLHKVLISLKKPVNLLFVFSSIQILSYPLFQLVPSPCKTFYDYGVVVNNLALSYVAGYIFYILTVIIPSIKKKNISIKNIKKLVEFLYKRIEIFEKKILNIIQIVDGENENNEKFNASTMDRLIEILTGNSFQRAIKADVVLLNNDCIRLMPDVTYIIDQILYHNEYLQDEILEDLMVLKNPNYYLFSEVSKYNNSIVVILNYEKNYFIDLDVRIRKIFQTIAENQKDA